MSWNSLIDSSENANGVRDDPRFSPKKMLFASAPSTWMLVPELRAPPIANWPPVVTSGCGLTSADRLRKSVKSRPLTGSPSICCVPTRWTTPPWVTSTRAACPVTSMPASCTAWTASAKFTVMTSPEVTLKPVRSAAPNPTDVTVTVYGPPGGRSGIA